MILLELIEMKAQTKIVLLVAVIGVAGAIVPALITKEPSKNSGQLEVIEASLIIHGVMPRVEERQARTFFIDVKSEWGADDGVERNGYISAPEGWRITSFTHTVGRSLGKKDPLVTVNKNGGIIDYRIKAKHGPWHDKWRHHAWLRIEYKIARNVTKEWKSKEYELADKLKIREGESTRLADLSDYKLPKNLQPRSYLINLHLRASQGAVESKVFKFNGKEANQEHKVLGGRLIKNGDLITLVDENDNLNR